MPTPRFEEMSRQQCTDLLQRSRVGRLAFSLHDAVDVVPISFKFRDNTIFGRTSPGGKLTTLDRNRRIAFEVDEFSGPFEWKSVVIHGSFYLLDAGADKTQSDLADLFPEAFGKDDPTAFRNQFFSIAIEEMTGRSAAPEAGQERPVVTAGRAKRSAAPEQDQQLRSRVEAEIASLSPRQENIKCAVERGAVILSGSVKDAHLRSALEGRVASLAGVRAIVQQIDIEWPVRIQPTPLETSLAASDIVRASISSTTAHVVVVYEGGWIRLEGHASETERQQIWSSLQRMAGSHGVVDRIRIAQ
jgi:nitroimidazol reductase NimA-like FMN-containing flavoprotein (pyridoxamine 5'-phosphate oxidase superfamily)